MYGELKRFIFLLMLVFGALGLVWSLLFWRFEDIFWGSLLLVALFFLEIVRGGIRSTRE